MQQVAREVAMCEERPSDMKLRGKKRRKQG